MVESTSDRPAFARECTLTPRADDLFDIFWECSRRTDSRESHLSTNSGLVQKVAMRPMPNGYHQVSSHGRRPAHLMEEGIPSDLDLMHEPRGKGGNSLAI